MTNKKTFLVITYVQLPSTVATDNLKKLITQVLNSQFKSTPRVHLIRYPDWSNSANLILSYIISSVRENNSFFFKQVFKDVSKTLNKKLNFKKVLYTTFGCVTLKLKGFKIKSTGRFDHSKNQMSTFIQRSGGSSPASKLNTYVEYSYNCLYTKSGSCSLHI